MKIAVNVYHDRKPNGDRATSTTPCLKWEVWLKEPQGTGMVLQTFDQFNAFHCAVDTSNHTEKEVMDYVSMLKNLTGFPVEWHHFEPRVNITWERKATKG